MGEILQTQAFFSLQSGYSRPEEEQHLAAGIAEPALVRDGRRVPGSSLMVDEQCGQDVRTSQHLLPGAAVLTLLQCLAWNLFLNTFHCYHFSGMGSRDRLRFQSKLHRLSAV